MPAQLAPSLANAGTQLFLARIRVPACRRPAATAIQSFFAGHSRKGMLASNGPMARPFTIRVSRLLHTSSTSHHNTHSKHQHHEAAASKSDPPPSHEHDHNHAHIASGTSGTSSKVDHHNVPPDHHASHAHSHGIFGHAGHSHSHGADENVLVGLFSKETNRAGVTVTLVGLFTNVGFTLVKAFAGWWYNSASLMADAAHQASDLISDVVTLAAFQISRREADAGHPFGYGRYEAIGALGVSGILIAGAVGTAWYSADVLIHVLQSASASASAAVPSIPSAAATLVPSTPAAGGISSLFNTIMASLFEPTLYHGPHLHGAGAGHSPAGVQSPSNPLDHWALVVTFASIVAKEGLFRWTMAVGTREKSSVLVANAWHHRSDAASSFVALIGVGGALVGVPILDPIGGLLVSGMIAKYGFDTAAESMRELADASVPHSFVHDVELVVAQLVKSDSNIASVSNIRARKVGPVFLIDLDLNVKATASVSTARAIADNLRQAIQASHPQVSEVSIDIDTAENGTPATSNPGDVQPVGNRPITPASASAAGAVPSFAGRPTSDFEDAVRSIVEDKAGFRDVTCSHITIHFLKDGLEVHVDIQIGNQDLTIRDAQQIANKVGESIVDGIPEVLVADVHLELNEHTEKEHANDTKRV
ncbi:hypothetical protein M427DRAFT_71507 [Gonapodya prolifera JEL478]|uniref:Uncharacterized protein n=1 Tax=Gonapodya prolifera (strain JEL478) TaxID=1344416 RepID=A0A139A946_GONPJ|nr:hypothetical protein M427DRAFT_71507 [Gonapodya prolifera JEL478]|eukprot:KXS13286.1 hypothetical protein M427DRAFT_71507 [Gonapodya prolifera JEL478]